MLMAIDFADIVIAKYMSDDALAVVGYCYSAVYFMMAIGVGLNQGLTIVATAESVRYGIGRIYEWKDKTNKELFEPT